jgi:hypothetical protein
VVNADIAAIQIGDEVVDQRAGLRVGIKRNDLGSQGIEARCRDNVVRETRARVGCGPAGVNGRSGCRIEDAALRNAGEVAAFSAAAGTVMTLVCPCFSRWPS